MNPPTTRWQYLKVIQLPRLWWYVSGMFIWSQMYSFWWLNIAKRAPLWPDADAENCSFRFCHYCGRGTI